MKVFSCNSVHLFIFQYKYSKKVNKWFNHSVLYVLFLNTFMRLKNSVCQATSTMTTVYFLEELAIYWIFHFVNKVSVIKNFTNCILLLICPLLLRTSKYLKAKCSQQTTMNEVCESVNWNLKWMVYISCHICIANIL